MGAKLTVRDRITPHEFNGWRQPMSERSDSEETKNIKFKTRTTTDVCFLLFMTVFLIVLLCLFGYCVFYGDVFRTINGYDNCGNVCGRPLYILKHNEKRSENCYSSEHASAKYHIVLKNNLTNKMDRYCVSNCSGFAGYQKLFNRCIQQKNKTLVDRVFSKTGIKNFFQEVAEDFHYCWTEFCYLCLISLAFSLMIMLLLRYLVGFVVWVVLVGVVVTSLTATIFLWILWKQTKDQTNILPENLLFDEDKRKTDTYFWFAIVATIVTIIVILIIFVMRKQIKLVVQLFKEAGNALGAMPLLLVEPILTFLCLGIVISVWFYLCLWIESSGHVTEKREQVYYFEKDIWMKITRWYNLLAIFWMIQFIIGCQHMVIAGAVSIWFFTRDKSKLPSPIQNSFYNLTRYHLGSIALGSLIIALVQFMRTIMKCLERYLHKYRNSWVDYILKCCHCCLYCFEKVLKYLTRNAYIEIAIYGYSFCYAGKQAFKLLSSNILRVAAINSVGDFILFLGKILVVTATVLIGIKLLQNKDGIQHMWVPISLAGVFAYFVAHCFMTVYEMVIDTIFLCFCEDCEQNDGITKPYFMSRRLMEYVENSKKALQLYDLKQNKEKSESEDISTISKSVEK